MIRFENFRLFHESRTLLTNYHGIFFPQKMIGILGPNGSGKTSFLKATAGLTPHYRGNIFIHGKNIKTYSLKDLAKMRAYSPATPVCHWSLTTEQLLSLETPFSQNDPLLDRLTLRPLLSHSFHTLSSGEKARVFCAFTLMKKTDILIFDEIISHLDDASQPQILRLLKEETQKGRTVILSLHQKDLAFSYCDQVLSLENQQFTVLKKPKDVLKLVP